MNILSLYDGMACGAIALIDSGIPLSFVDNYFAFEIDKYAIKTAKHNLNALGFPYHACGNALNAKFDELPPIDLLLGGSPCTFFSISQSTSRRETIPCIGVGWKLFETYAIALRQTKPRFFLFENVCSMSTDIKDAITTALGVEPVLIDSALVSCQSRKRYYWVGVRQPDGSYIKANVTQPLDRNILLKDIIENNCLVGRAKARAVIASAGRTTAREYFVKSQGNVCFMHKPQRIGSMPKKNGDVSRSQALRIYSPVGKTVTLTAASRGGAKTGLYAFENGKTFEVHNRMLYYKEKQYPINLPDGTYDIRKLNIRECARAQTIPEWYEFPVSDTQAYKLIGNGWTVEVIKHIFCAIGLSPAHSPFTFQHEN